MDLVSSHPLEFEVLTETIIIIVTKFQKDFDMYMHGVQLDSVVTASRGGTLPSSILPLAMVHSVTPRMGRSRNYFNWGGGGVQC